MAAGGALAGAEGALAYQGETAALSEETAWRDLLHRLYYKPWVIYAKRPFAGPEQVIRYLGRYTHRIAISNHRLRNLKDSKVSFTWKDYRKGGKKGVIALKATEFLRRFCLHILPPGFTRLRHYGILASRNKTLALAQARESLGVQAPPEAAGANLAGEAPRSNRTRSRSMPLLSLRADAPAPRTRSCCTQPASGPDPAIHSIMIPKPHAGPGIAMS